MKISPTTDKQIPNKDGGVLLYGWDTLRKEQGAHKCWGAMKKKSDVGPISFLAEEKNNILLLNTIPAEFVATIQYFLLVVSLFHVTGLSFGACVCDTGAD